MGDGNVTKPLEAELRNALVDSSQSVTNEERAKNFQQLARELRAHWKSRSDRYLHHVHYVDMDESNEKVMEKNNLQKSAFFGLEKTDYNVTPNNDTKISIALRRVIFIEMEIGRTGEVDATEDTFRSKFRYFLTWLATHEEVLSYRAWLERSKSIQPHNSCSKKDFSQESDQWFPNWMPYLDFANAIDVVHFKQISPFIIKRGDDNTFEDSNGHKVEWDVPKDALGFDPRIGYWIRVQFEADVVFSEEWKLENFPFDCQDFTMSFQLSRQSADEVDILPFPRSGNFVSLGNRFTLPAEWILRNLVTEFRYSDPEISKSLQTFAIFEVRIKASRVWKLYLGSFVIILCLFTLGLSAFALKLDSENLSNRLNYCAVFLLAQVSALPLAFDKKIQYLTFLDWYAFTSVLFLFAVTVWSCILGLVAELKYLEYSVDQYDGWGFYAFLILFLYFHIPFVQFLIVNRFTEASKLRETSSQLRKRYASQLKDKSIAATWSYEKLLQYFDKGETSQSDTGEKSEKKIKERNEKRSFIVTQSVYNKI